jgi:hypothetical protein
MYSQQLLLLLNFYLALRRFAASLKQVAGHPGPLSRLEHILG